MSIFSQRNRRFRGRGRRGITIVLMALLLVVIVALTAFAVDVGIMYLDRSQIQNAVDSAALAANLKMKESDNALLAAAEAENFIQLNKVGMNETIPDEAITVTIGDWDEDTQTFDPTASSPNAVQVNGMQDGESYWFAKIFGLSEFGVVGQATATGGNSKLDFAMVLDLSGSMQWEGRIEAQTCKFTFRCQVHDYCDGHTTYPSTGDVF